MTKVYVSYNGIVKEAIGPQPRDALLFASPEKSLAQFILEERAERRENSQLLKETLKIVFER